MKDPNPNYNCGGSSEEEGNNSISCSSNNNNNNNDNNKNSNSIDSSNQSSSSTKSDVILQNAIDEFVCPITMELPSDPVIAEDGRIYEREAIQQLITQQKQKQNNTNNSDLSTSKNSSKSLIMIRSPITNKLIGTRLIPAVQVRNVIESIVKSGAILDNDSRAEKWLLKIKNEKDVNEMKNKANNGDLDSMYIIGVWYGNGEKGLKVNHLIAFHWYKKAAYAGHVKSMATAGCYLVKGIAGIEKNINEGLCLLCGAAGIGSDLAAYHVGFAYKHGFYGLSRNLEMSKFWLSKAIDETNPCQHQHMKEILRVTARSTLQELNTTIQKEQQQQQQQQQQKKHQVYSNGNASCI